MDDDRAMTRQGRVAVVMVNYNGFEYSRECIDSLQKLDYPNSILVFVDNGSTDGSGDAICNIYKDAIVYLPLTENRGVTGGNNAGIDYALEHHLDYVLFLNNDTIVDSSMLGRMVETSRENGDALVVPKIVCYYDQKRLDHWIGPDFDWQTGRPEGYQRYPYDSPQLSIRSEIKVASTCCLLAPTSVLRAVGGMDENYFMYYDDADFTIRATRAGYRMMYEPESIVYHKCNKTTSTKQPAHFEFYLINRNFFYFYNKLCDRAYVKYLFLIQCWLRLGWHFVRALKEGDSAKRRVVQLVVQDIIARRMGPPPQVPPFVRTSH